jgi:DNA-binding IclR family transcriptional regulator
MSDGNMEKILDCLRKAAPKDLSIEEVAKLTKINRNTVAKYLFALEREGKIALSRRLGKAKLYAVKAKG